MRLFSPAVLTIRDQLLLRCFVVQLIGVMKFLHGYPIENLEVEQQFFSDLQQQCNLLSLQVVRCKNFFKQLIDDSKLIQQSLYQQFTQSRDPALSAQCYWKQSLTHVMQYYPEHEEAWTILASSDSSTDEKLRVCRQLIVTISNFLLSSKT